MARRITQFFSSVPIKSRKIDEQLNQEELPKVFSIYSDLSDSDHPTILKTIEMVVILLVIKLKVIAK